MKNIQKALEELNAFMEEIQRTQGEINQENGGDRLAK